MIMSLYCLFFKYLTLYTLYMLLTVGSATVEDPLLLLAVEAPSSGFSAPTVSFAFLDLFGRFCDWAFMPTVML